MPQHEVLEPLHISDLQTSTTSSCKFGRCCGPIINTILTKPYRVAVCVFCLYASRLVIVPLWTIPHIPLLSPIYHQGKHWRASSTNTVAILTHVVLGVIQLLAGLHQLSRQPGTRPPNKVHRRVGFLYVVTGLGNLASLHVLFPILGRGDSEHPNTALIVMVEYCSVLWLLAVSFAIWSVRRGMIVRHRIGMVVSYAVVLTPLTQRVLHVFLVPLAMFYHSLVDEQGQDAGRGVAAGGQKESTSDLYSFQGYGRTGQEVLAVSAWAGLFVNLAVAYRVLRQPVHSHNDIIMTLSNQTSNSELE